MAVKVVKGFIFIDKVGRYLTADMTWEFCPTLKGTHVHQGPLERVMMMAVEQDWTCLPYEYLAAAWYGSGYVVTKGKPCLISPEMWGSLYIEVNAYPLIKSWVWVICPFCGDVHLHEKPKKGSSGVKLSDCSKKIRKGQEDGRVPRNKYRLVPSPFCQT